MFSATDDLEDIHSILSSHVKTAVLLSHKKVDTRIDINVKFVKGEGEAPVGKISEKTEQYRISLRVTYKM